GLFKFGQNKNAKKTLQMYIIMYICKKTMITISVSEFRGNIKKYLDIAQEEKILIHRGKGKTYAIVPIAEINDEPYNPEFVAKIMRSKEDSEKGRVTFIKTEDLWK
ncbi:type II toxin-antitoxin system Phd/YefM family antitoxin, partial [Flavobacterium psychrophilum]|uniref:type II toxin-antitoxin system Phd/YefM family antitoxin n=1 Tax=Flavobacterium psychrophilum TaxID=96345 RepID=UPI003138BF7D